MHEKYFIKDIEIDMSAHTNRVQLYLLVIEFGVSSGTDFLYLAIQIKITIQASHTFLLHT